jgi:yeast amino acid transporter
MIAISATIGLGIFVNGGKALRVAGPAGALFAFAFVGLVAIAVLECIAEMIGIWPVSNPFGEFLKVFVDEDLATVMGIAYW